MPSFVLHHTALIAASIDRTVAFYTDVFEMKVVLRKPATLLHEYGPLEVVFLQAAQGTLEIIGPMQRAEVPLVSEPVIRPLQALRHVGFAVEDVEAAAVRCEELGHKVRRLYDTNGLLGGAHLTDPDGALVELFSLPAST